MSPYEAEMICRTIMSERIREAERGRLAREMRKAERRSNSSPATASATRHSRVWRLVHLSHAYG
ncbi:MAG TPA: hypothetical protein VFN19_06505 [Candidatus Nanopelagicales bacterium]|nr:hypothetical protein [Candidatus Nanopelagicales bacterium]